MGDIYKSLEFIFNGQTLLRGQIQLVCNFISFKRDNYDSTEVTTKKRLIENSLLLRNKLYTYDGNEKTRFP